MQVYRRTAALLAVHEGRSVNEVAAVLGVTRQTIYNWLNGCVPDRTELNLEDAPRPGRPSIGDGTLDRLLERVLQKSPDELGHDSTGWSTPLLRAQVILEHGPAVSEETIRRRVRRLGYHWSGRRYVRKRPFPAPFPAKEG